MNKRGSFEAWTTKEDLVRWKHNDKVSEEYLLQKVKGLCVFFSDKDAVYKVSNSNLEYKGRDGWVAIAEKERDDDLNSEPLAFGVDVRACCGEL